MRLSGISKYSQVLAFIILASISFFWNFIELWYPSITIHKLIALVLITMVATIIYFDTRIDKILSRPEGIIKKGSLRECLDSCIRDNSHFKELRVHATSSEMIQPFIAAGNIHIDKCYILINLKKVNGQIDMSDKYNMRVHHILDEWRQLKTDGYINNLEIKDVNALPLSYEVIFGQKAMLIGKYYLRSDVPSGVEYMPPYIFRDFSRESKSMIQDHVQAFDKSFRESKPVDQL